VPVVRTPVRSARDNIYGAEMLPKRLHEEDQFTHEDVAPAFNLEACYSGADRRRERRAFACENQHRFKSPKSSRG